jgi:hypothetical protein
VDAAFLSLLLVRGIPPILTDCQIQEVHFQTENRRWETDDFLIVGVTGAGQQRSLAGQVKRNFTVSESDDECRKTFQDFWSDFRNVSLFHADTDRFALTILRGTNVLLEHFCGLLDCARAAINAADFTNRLSTQGYLSKTARKYCGEIRKIIEAAQGSPVGDDDLWQFLRVIHVLSFDLNTSTSQTEAAITTLLALTAVGHDQVGAARATWRDLLALVGSGMPHAASFNWDTLPAEIRQRHTPVGDADHAAIRLLREHSATVVQGIHVTIGEGFHLTRENVADRLLETVEESRVVIVTGPSGSGKSAVARGAFEQLEADHIAFAFRAEEFATAHLDETLQKAQLSLNAARLSSLLSGQGRKVLLVESVERLLEAPVRDAFSDLLNLVWRDESWRLILTCRDYSLDTVRTSFLDRANLRPAVISVPPLREVDIDSVVAAIPKLARPAANASMRKLMYNPYNLDKAARMVWPEGTPLPQDERSFRTKFWHEVVREDAEAANAFPRRRERVFQEIALRRARALVPFVSCVDLDQPAIDRLHHCGLLAYAQQTDTLAAPAHDVLEDWALLTWIEAVFAAHPSDPRAFAAELGTYPAIRRAYRKWLGESLECTPETIDSFVRAVVNDRNLPAQFRDDTFVSLLLSSTGGNLIARNTDLLLAQNGSLLRRIIHILRVACKTTPPWLSGDEVLAIMFLVPHGPAWPAVLALVRNHLDLFLPGDLALLLGLVEDWSGSVAWWEPSPPGAGDAVAIAHALLPHLNHYNTEKQRKTALGVIAKVPTADEPSFLGLVKRAAEKKQRDLAARDFAEILLSGITCAPACRDMPDAIIQLTQAHLCLASDDDIPDDSFGTDIDLELLFGLRPHRHFEFFPASALGGPFFALLQHHPRRGVDFIIWFVNHSTEWYATHRDPQGIVEPPWEVKVHLSDGTSVSQWCNQRLWQLYRGTSVGPTVLQCALMALERWLLELCVSHPERVQRWLYHILRTGTSGATTAIVASVATAYPHVAGDAALPLIACRELFDFDRDRWVHEAQAPSHLLNAMPLPRATDSIYAGDRKKADALPHRRSHLESVALNLQLGPLRDQVQIILDNYRRAAPPVGEQIEGDRLWRLAVHRMDLRKYAPEPQPEPPGVPADNASATDPSGVPSPRPAKVVLRMTPPDTDIQAMIDRDAPADEASERQTSLAFWSTAVFRRDREPFADPEQWQDRLREAREIAPDGNVGSPPNESRMLNDGPIFAAAIAVRDHWDALPDEDRKWCLRILGAAIERDCDTDNQLLAVSRGGFDGACPAAIVLPLIFTKSLSPSKRADALRLLSLALTHGIGEVVHYAAESAGYYLWSEDPDLAIACVGALALYAKALDELHRQNPQRHFFEPYSDQRQSEHDSAERVRRSFPIPAADCERELLQLDFEGLHVRWALRNVLSVLRSAPARPVIQQFFSRIAAAVAGWWHASRSHRGTEQAGPIELMQACIDHLCRFVLQLPPPTAVEICQPIIDAIESEPHEAASFIRALIFAEDQTHACGTFWGLWQAVADQIPAARWLEHLDSGHSSGERVVRDIFLNVEWKEDARHWHSLEGYADRLDALFDRLPPSGTVLQAYLRFLYHIGEHSLPEAFIVIDRGLRRGDRRAMLADSNTRFYLESLLQRFVYSNPVRLKTIPELRDSVLHTLDELVESGSSIAYRMRDDFVTPLPLPPATAPSSDPAGGADRNHAPSLGQRH